MENGQFLERFRSLSRDIQLSIQEVDKTISNISTPEEEGRVKYATENLDKIVRLWSDFSDWILVSTLDDIDEAKSNCSAGLLSLNSKIVRAKSVYKRLLKQKRIQFKTVATQDYTIMTFIAYFEQLLNLLIENAIKYSPTNSEIEVHYRKENNYVELSIESIGPIVNKDELSLVSDKGFRTQAAVETKLPGQGYGLYNVAKIAKLLGVKIKFDSMGKRKFPFEGVPYAPFIVTMQLPFDINHNIAS